MPITLLFLAFVLASDAAQFEQVGTKLTPSDSTMYFGCSTAVSANGKVLFVGAPFDNNYLGAVYIYEQDEGGNYGTPTKKIGTGAVVGPGNIIVGQGISITGSGDGLTMATGAPGDAGGVGAVWIFYHDLQQRDWIQQNKIIGIGMGQMGLSVSLSFDGKTLAIGAPSDADRGSVYIWKRDQILTWSQEALLYPNDIQGSGFGCSVSLSSDGTIFAAGGYQDNSNLGATWIFQKDGVWSQLGPKIVATGSSEIPQSQGRFVSLSGDGKVLAIGGPDISAVWVYERDTTDSSNWVETGHLPGTGGDTSQQGGPVLVSKNGKMLFSAAIYDNQDPNDRSTVGAVYVFEKNEANGQWEQQGSKLAPNDYFYGPNFGMGLSISDDGLLLIGGPLDNSTTETSHGAVWIFRNREPTPEPTPEPTTLKPTATTTPKLTPSITPTPKLTTATPTPTATKQQVKTTTRKPTPKPTPPPTYKPNNIRFVTYSQKFNNIHFGTVFAITNISLIFKNTVKPVWKAKLLTAKPAFAAGAGAAKTPVRMTKIDAKAKVTLKLKPNLAKPFLVYALNWPAGDYLFGQNSWVLLSKNAAQKIVTVNGKKTLRVTKTFSGIINFPPKIHVITWEGRPKKKRTAKLLFTVAKPK